MNRQHTLLIIDRHKLSNSTVGRLARVDCTEVFHYKLGRVGKKSSEKIETTMIEWERKLNENRCRLLIGTGWEYLYCNK